MKKFTNADLRRLKAETEEALVFKNTVMLPGKLAEALVARLEAKDERIALLEKVVDTGSAFLRFPNSYAKGHFVKALAAALS